MANMLKGDQSATGAVLTKASREATILGTASTESGRPILSAGEDDRWSQLPESKNVEDRRPDFGILSFSQRRAWIEDPNMGRRLPRDLGAGELAKAGGNLRFISPGDEIGTEASFSGMLGATDPAEKKRRAK